MSASGDGDQPELQLNDTPSEGLAAALQDPAPLTEDQQRELARLMDEEMTEPHDNGLQADEIKSMEIFADDSVQGFFKHAGPVYGLALNPSGQQLCLSGDGEETAWLWDITTGEAVTSHNDHTDSIIACEFSFDGQFYATGAMDGTIRVYVTETKEAKHVLEGPDEVVWMKWHRKGHVIIAGGADGMVWMFNASKGSVMQVFAGHRGDVMSGCFSGDGKTVITGGADASVRIWDPKTGKCTFAIEDGSQPFAPAAPVCCIAAHSGRQLVIAGCVDGNAMVININTGKVIKHLKPNAKPKEKKSNKQILKEAKKGMGQQEAEEFGVEAVGFCNAGDVFLCSTANLDGKLRIWDVSTGSCRVTCEHDSAVVKTLWHPTEPTLFSCSVDRTMRRWDARTGKCLNTWEGASDTILELVFSVILGKIVCASDDSQIFVFDADRGKNERNALQTKLNAEKKKKEESKEGEERVDA